MKPFSTFLKKLPAQRRTRIDAAVHQRITAIRLQNAREQFGVTQEELATRLFLSRLGGIILPLGTKGFIMDQPARRMQWHTSPPEW